MAKKELAELQQREEKARAAKVDNINASPAESEQPVLPDSEPIRLVHALDDKVYNTTNLDILLILFAFLFF